jgi:peptidoglycan/LPS O-acetylase OafA/YrhL
MFGTYRALLAVMVVLLHYGFVPYSGQYAVFGFFILSGYLMTFIMQNNYGYSWRGILGYSLNRFLRIYPLYWVSCLLSLLVLLSLDPLYTSDFNQNYFLPKTLTQWFRNITLIIGFNGPGVLISPAWALTVELFFYLCIGLGISRNRIATITWFTISLFYTLFLVLNGASFDARYHTIGAASLPFSTGAVIYHWRDKLRRQLGLLANHDFSPAMLFVLLIINWAVAKLTGNLSLLGFYINYAICSVIMITLFHRKTLPLVSRKTDNWLGALSYPIYLIHYPLAFLFLSIYKKLGLGFEGPSILVFFISLPFLVLLSWLMAVTVERPVELLRSIIKRSL